MFVVPIFRGRGPRQWNYDCYCTEEYYRDVIQENGTIQREFASREVCCFCHAMFISLCLLFIITISALVFFSSFSIISLIVLSVTSVFFIYLSIGWLKYRQFLLFWLCKCVKERNETIIICNTKKNDNQFIRFQSQNEYQVNSENCEIATKCVHVHDGDQIIDEGVERTEEGGNNV